MISLNLLQDQLRGSHDLRLSQWGPYTKRYMGISHIPDPKTGLRFDLSVFPGLYRRNINIPNVTWESGYHPWEAAPDLSYYSHRHDMIWKDQVYCDVAFHRLDETAALIRAECINQTEAPQNLVLHYMASLHFPPIRTNSTEALKPVRVVYPRGAIWVNAMAYEEIHYAKSNPQATLVYDGHLRGEIRAHGFVDGIGLGQGFGQNNGDRVTYSLTLSQPIEDARLMLRYKLPEESQSRVQLSGLTEKTLLLFGSGDLALHTVNMGALPAGTHQLTLTAQGETEIQFDGFIITPVGLMPHIYFEPVVWNPRPQRLDSPDENSLCLQYDHIDQVYGLAWGAESFQVREFICDELDSWMRYMVHHHVSDVLRGPGEGHFTNGFIRPIFLEPQSNQIFYGLVCTGDQRTVFHRLADFDPKSDQWETTYQAARNRIVDLQPNPAGEAYHFSQARMAATTLTNIVYPVRTRGTWIRHSAPGRWWDSLYTWDSGFIGLGLVELDLDRAVDNLNAYVTEPGTSDAAFIHHGSPVPTQFYVFLELWNRTQDRDLLTYFYPRLQQYHRFLAGRLGSSTTRNLKSDLLRTWDYFYNSGGWDDYPPQVYVHRQGLEASVTPAANTAQAIRTAKILRMAALALDEDPTEYDADIAAFSQALQDHAWDSEAGYFSYVQHDDQGQPQTILRHESGLNFNMGLDGASPLIAGICTSDQENILLNHLFNQEQLWSRCGLSTVDQSTPYYRPDGYWNGAVWMPHQWFYWKTLLDLGQAEGAHQIAQTGLDVWRQEVDQSYNCFEHFIVQTGRGAGWHHFGGLSTPVLAWYSAYHRPGRLTTGFDTWVQALDLGADHHSLKVTLACFGQAHHAPLVIATLDPEATYTVTWNDQSLEYQSRYPGTLEIRLPAGATQGELVIK